MVGKLGVCLDLLKLRGPQPLGVLSGQPGPLLLLLDKASWVLAVRARA